MEADVRRTRKSTKDGTDDLNTPGSATSRIGRTSKRTAGVVRPHRRTRHLILHLTFVKAAFDSLRRRIQRARHCGAARPNRQPWCAHIRGGGGGPTK